MTNWNRLTEAQIRKAEADGTLRGLEGEGNPLPHRPGDALIDPGDAVGFPIMAEADAAFPAAPERLARALILALAANGATVDAAAAEGETVTRHGTVPGKRAHLCDRDHPGRGWRDAAHRDHLSRTGHRPGRRQAPHHRHSRDDARSAGSA